ncbi:hypothetical protein [Sphingomonas aerophila]|uniref:Uncharacterized protein n=1 Tax=Sphingomonas aerophila TaxID=1344948 RepID=A0A7W9EU83_9SPHN|nr:hypothetical protein [Sphingomonas aerophila]MBB5715009.1 hypothetical protein [Sphingomonas aerophila]
MRDGPVTEGDGEQPCAEPAVPASMVDNIAGHQWVRSAGSDFGGPVCRLHGRPGVPDLLIAGRGGRMH